MSNITISWYNNIPAESKLKNQHLYYMNFQDTIYTAFAILASLGISSGIILGFGKWFGNIIANRILDRYKFQHEKDLEALKTKYSTELEMTKAELERSKHQFFKYSDKQFELYNNLWKVLWRIKNLADSLWEKADPKKLPLFAEYLRNTKEVLYVNILIIEESHFDKLIHLIEEFEAFNFGKKKLIELRKADTTPPEKEDDGDFEDIKTYSEKDEEVAIYIPKEDVQRVIAQNWEVKQRFDKEIMELAKVFRQRISG
jgi:hypothetical protein